MQARTSVAADAGLAASLTVLNDVLASKTFLVAESVTLADIAVAAAVRDVFELFLAAEVGTVHVSGCDVQKLLVV